MHARRGSHWHNLDINIMSFNWSIEYKLQARSEKLYMLLWRKINIHSNIYTFEMFTDCDNLFSCYFGFVALNILMFTSALCLVQQTMSAVRSKKTESDAVLHFIFFSTSIARCTERVLSKNKGNHILAIKLRNQFSVLIEHCSLNFPLDLLHFVKQYHISEQILSDKVYVYYIALQKPVVGLRFPLLGKC